jgi:ribosome maturation factor RimP
MSDLQSQLESALKPLVEGVGLEFWGMELVRSRGHALLRVYIERPDMRVTVDDCARASRAMSDTLDQLDLIAENYDLEVSSPGLDRPLYTLAHYARFVGEEVKLETHLPIAGRKRYRARIARVEQGIELHFEKQQLTLQLSDIAKARIVPDYSKPSPYQVAPDATVEEEPL